jgi:hypothetical protein
MHLFSITHAKTHTEYDCHAYYPPRDSKLKVVKFAVREVQTEKFNKALTDPYFFGNTVWTLTMPAFHGYILYTHIFLHQKTFKHTCPWIRQRVLNNLGKNSHAKCTSRDRLSEELQFPLRLFF